MFQSFLDCIDLLRSLRKPLPPHRHGCERPSRAIQPHDQRHRGACHLRKKTQTNQQNREKGSPIYWLAQVILAIHSTSSTGRILSSCSGFRDFSSYLCAVLRRRSFAITSPSRVLSTNSVPPPNIGVRRDDDNIAVAVHRLHALATDFQGVRMGVTDIRKRNFIPARARGIAGIVKKTFRSSLRIADDGYVFKYFAYRSVIDIRQKLPDVGIRRIQYF